MKETERRIAVETADATQAFQPTIQASETISHQAKELKKLAQGHTPEVKTLEKKLKASEARFRNKQAMKDAQKREIAMKDEELAEKDEEIAKLKQKLALLEGGDDVVIDDAEGA